MIEILDDFVQTRLDEIIPQRSHSEDWDLDSISELIGSVIPVDTAKLKNDIYSMTRDDLIEFIKKVALDIYELKEQRIGSDRMRFFERAIILSIIDGEWKDTNCSECHTGGEME